jgi:alkyl hydroperoxide reductase subunit AhpC
MLDQTNIGAQGLPMTVRSVFIINPAKKISLIIVYPASCGRNFNEIFRVLDSLQLTAKSSLVTPANWQPGQDAIIAPSVPDAK